MKRVIGLTAALLLTLSTPAEAGNRSSADFPRVNLQSSSGGSLELVDNTIAIPPTPGLYFGAGRVSLESDRTSGGDPHVNITQDASEIVCAAGTGVLQASFTTYGSRYAGMVTLFAYTNIATLDQSTIDQDPDLGEFARSVLVESSESASGAPKTTNLIKLCVPTFQ